MGKAERQTGGYADRWMDKHTVGWTNRQSGRRKSRETQFSADSFVNSLILVGTD